jgi:hypothetical protein
VTEDTVQLQEDDVIFQNKFEETLFRWLILTTFLQIFSHPHLSLCADGVVCSSLESGPDFEKM